MWQRWVYRDNLWGLIVRLAAIAGVVYLCIRASAVFSAFIAALILAQITAPLVEIICNFEFPLFKSVKVVPSLENQENTSDSKSIDLESIAPESTILPTDVYDLDILATLENIDIAPTDNIDIKNRVTKKKRGFSVMNSHTKKMIAVFLVFIFFGLSIYMVINLFIQPFKIEWTQLLANKNHHMATLQGKWADIQDWWNNQVPPEVREYFQKQQGDSKTPEIGAKIAETVQHFIGEATKSVGHVVELILLPVLAFYFIVEGHELRREFLLLFPRNRTRQVIAVLEEGGQIMRNYLIAQVWLAVIAGVITSVLLLALQVPYALTLGLIAGITRAVPVVGPILGGIPVVGVALTQTDRPWLWVTILIIFTCLHLFESKILMPRFLGHHLQLHAVIIIFALLIGGEFFGLGGMFLAAPLAALARTLYVHYVVKPWEQKGTRKRSTTRLERAIHSTTPSLIGLTTDLATSEK